MSVMLTRVDDHHRTVVTVTDDLDASEVLAVIEPLAATSTGTFLIDVTRAREVSPVALAMLTHSELWPRMWLWGLSHNGERLLRLLGSAPATVGA